jgi:AhpD family alkylhydroperoxidase
MGSQGLPEDLAALIENDEAAAEKVIDFLINKRGGMGLMVKVLSRRPDVFVPHVLQQQRVMAEPKAIDAKTAELAAVAASAALMCDHCLIAHMRAAQSKGASLEEIFDVLLVAGNIAASSTWAVAFRKFRQLEGDHDSASAEAME